MRISIIGAGRLGGALAIALARKAHSIENIFVRTSRKPDKLLTYLPEPRPAVLTERDYQRISSELVIIATQDGEIESAAEKLARSLPARPIVLHTSGSLSSAVLKELQTRGSPVGSLHPLVSVSDPVSGAESFTGVYFCVEGDAEAAAAASRLAADLGGESFSVPTEHKALYHAAAVTACGHLVALLDHSFEMLTRCGLGQTEAKKILLPLVESTIGNLATQSPAEALTGPFARADADTFRRHLAVMQDSFPAPVLGIYLELGRRSLELSKKKIDDEKYREMDDLLLLAKKNLKC